MSASNERPGPYVASLQTGKVAPLGPGGVASGFVKRPVDGPRQAGLLGIEGDEIADLRVHGGPDKAVYAYALSHYDSWAQEMPQHRDRLQPGVFGENLTIDGMTEDGICAGDIHRIGSVLLQVVQPRQPCFKFGLRFDDPKMPLHMKLNRRAGWYYRVLEPGMLRQGDAVALVDRPYPDFDFPRLVKIVYGYGTTREDLERMAQMDGLAGWLRSMAQHHLNDAE